MSIIVVNGPDTGGSSSGGSTVVLGGDPPEADGEITFDASVTGQVTLQVMQAGVVRGNVILVE